MRLKVEIHEIEERKNQHINDLMTNHEKAFKEMKDYYNDITRENLDLIKMHREKLVDINATIESNQKTVDGLKRDNEDLQVPLAQSKQKRDKLKKDLATFDKDEMALRNAKARLQVLKKTVKEMRTEKIEMDAKYQKLQKECDDMYKKFELAITQLHRRADYKNNILEEKLRQFQDELEKKEAQLHELV